MDKVYIDSNIFIYHLFSQKYHWSGSFLKNVEEGRYNGIVSHLTILETISRGRQLLTKDTRMTQEEIKREISENIKIFWAMPNLTIIPENKGIDLMSIFEDAFTSMKKYYGHVNLRDGKREHKGMYAADTIHLAIAKKIGCNKLVTTDGDFSEIDPKLENLTILNLN